MTSRLILLTVALAVMIVATMLPSDVDAGFLGFGGKSNDDKDDKTTEATSSEQVESEIEDDDEENSVEMGPEGVSGEVRVRQKQLKALKLEYRLMTKEKLDLVNKIRVLADEEDPTKNRAAVQGLSDVLEVVLERIDEIKRQMSVLRKEAPSRIIKEQLKVLPGVD